LEWFFSAWQFSLIWQIRNQELRAVLDLLVNTTRRLPIALEELPLAA